MKETVKAEALRAEEILIDSLPIELKKDSVKVNGLEINFLSAGNGKPLLLLHGATIGWGQWSSNVVDLSKRFKLYMPDLPGCGFSSKVDFFKSDMKDIFVNTVREFITSFSLTQLSAIGHSFGGWIILNLAINQPNTFSKIVLVDSVGFENYVPLYQRLLSVPGLANLISAGVLGGDKEKSKRFLQSVLYKKEAELFSEEFINYFHKVRLMPGAQNLFYLIGSSINFMGMKPEFVLKDSLKELKIPTMVAWGENDSFFPYSFIKKLETSNENAFISFTSYPKTGHAPNIEEADKFNKEVINFLLS